MPPTVERAIGGWCCVLHQEEYLAACIGADNDDASREAWGEEFAYGMEEPE